MIRKQLEKVIPKKIYATRHPSLISWLQIFQEISNYLLWLK